MTVFLSILFFLSTTRRNVLYRIPKNPRVRPNHHHRVSRRNLKKREEEEEEEAAESYEEEERRAAEKHLRKQISLFKMLALSASGVVGFRAASSSGASASASASAMHGSTTSIRRCVGGRRRRRGARQQKDVFCRSEALDSSAFKELLGSFDGSPAFSGKTEKNKGNALSLSLSHTHTHLQFERGTNGF